MVELTIHGGDRVHSIYLAHARTHTQTHALTRPPPTHTHLQGHEDLRQDERVMQLFGLVNTMLANDRATAERDLSIARYAGACA